MVDWGGGDFLQSAAIALGLFVEYDSLGYLMRVPRSRLPAPLRGSTPRQCLILRLDFRYLCRSAQDDTEEDRTVGYNPYVVKVT